MSGNVNAFISRLNSLAAAYSRMPREIAAASGRVYANSIRSQIYRVAPGGKMRGVGKNGARVGVSQTISGGDGLASSIVRGTGPLAILERGAKPHDIPRNQDRRFLGSQQRSFAAVGPVHHPGSPAKHPFELGVLTAGRLAVTNAVTDSQRIIRGAYR